MKYQILTSDFGQGDVRVALPVSFHNANIPQKLDRPLSAVEVLKEYYGEDFGLTLGNFMKMEVEYLHENGILRRSQNIRLLSYHHRMTKSRIEQDPGNTVVDFIVHGTLEGTNETDSRKNWENADFRIRYILNMKPCTRTCIGPMINLYRGDDDYLSRFPTSTNEYLLPVLYAQDYENVAHRIIQYYFPELGSEISDGSWVQISADDLAGRMGLEVQEVRFSDPSIMGQLYYNYAEVELLDERGRRYFKSVKPCTILISRDNCNTEGIRNSTIAHECCHMYLDRWFFLLQMMAGHKISAYTNRRKQKKKHFRENTAVDWMEYQCEKMPAYILMECGSTRNFVNEQLKAMGGIRSPQNMRSLIQKVASQFHVSFAMAKYRLIELGYHEAEGIGCYVNQTLVPDHGCSGAWPEGLSYTISAEDVLRKASEDPRFASLLGSGRYRYLEGHICLNSRRYIAFDCRGKAHLSAYARCHIDECCMAFQAYGSGKIATFQPGVAARSKTKPVKDQYRSSYELAAEPGTDAYVRENDIFADDCWLWGDYYYHMDTDYKEAIVGIMKRKGITQEALANELNVDRKVIYNCLNAGNPSKPHLVAICVALKLPYFVSEKIIEQAGITFRDIELDHLYRQFLLKAEELSIERCEDILKQRNFPTLFERSA